MTALQGWLSELTESKRRQRADEQRNRRNSTILKRFDEVLLPHQIQVLEDTCYTIQIRRFGLFRAITKGPLGKQLKLTPQQIQEFEKIANELPDRYQEFSKTTIQWYCDQIFEVIEDKNERKIAKELFDPSFKIISTPIGCLIIGRKVDYKVR